METWNNGPHLLEFEPPDIFHCHVRAPIQEHEVRETVRITRQELGAKRGIKVYFVAHMEGKDGTFTPGARKYLGATDTQWKAIAIVGGNTMVRAAANVTSRAMSLLSERKIPFKMVKTVEEARQFIEELRAKEAGVAVASAG